jgi:hypothetical protein
MALTRLNWIASDSRRGRTTTIFRAPKCCKIYIVNNFVKAHFSGPFSGFNAKAVPRAVWRGEGPWIRAVGWSTGEGKWESF